MRRVDGNVTVGVTGTGQRGAERSLGETSLVRGVLLVGEVWPSCLFRGLKEMVQVFTDQDRRTLLSREMVPLDDRKNDDDDDNYFALPAS